MTGGNGGNGADADGGGIIDQFGGTLQILHSTIIYNAATGGAGGKGGPGFSSAGSDGSGGSSYGGGLYVSVVATACATPDTQIVENQADNGPDVYGTLGTC